MPSNEKQLQCQTKNCEVSVVNSELVHWSAKGVDLKLSRLNPDPKASNAGH